MMLLQVKSLPEGGEKISRQYLRKRGLIEFKILVCGPTGWYPLP